MSLTLDELKAKAEEIEAAEQNAPATIDGEDPMEEFKPTEDPVEPTPPVEGEEPTPPIEDPIDEPEPLELDAEGNPIEKEFAFDPNIKVMDNEVQVPDFLAKSVSNEEEAKALTELFEKSHGLDSVKAKRDHFKEKSSEFEGKYNDKNTELNSINENLDYLGNLIEQNDLQTFQQHAKITDDQILARASQIIQYRDLTPEQKIAYDSNIQSRQRLTSLESENTELRQTHVDAEVQRTQTELDSVISSEAYSQVAEQFDARLGDGAFQKEVIQRAMHMEQSTRGKTIWSPDQAVEETVRVLGLNTQSQSPSEPTQQPQTSVTTAPAAPERTVVIGDRKPTMLKVDGGAKSPARPIVRSIDDIRKLADQHSHG